MTDPALYGVIAEFTTPDGLVKACRKAHDAGYRRMDAYTPFPLEEAAEAIGFREDPGAAADVDRRHSGRAERIRFAILGSRAVPIR